MLDSASMAGVDWGQATAVALCFLSGSVPYGFLIPKANGVNILEQGSGNPGAANVLYEVGPWAAVLVLLGDSMKGCLPLIAVGIFFPGELRLQAVCGGAAILAHCWTPFLRFRGGKAVATSMGVFLALAPLPIALTLVIFIAVVKLSGHISVGSMAGAVALPTLTFLFRLPQEVRILAVCAGLLVLFRHIPNIKLLLSHQEIG